MIVHTVITDTLYGGKQEQKLCKSCSAHVAEVIQCNAEYCYFPYVLKELNDWHEGVCEEHEYHQNCLDKRFKQLYQSRDK